MAYNKDNYETEVVLDVEKNQRGDHIIVSKMTTKSTGSVAVDVRNYYTNKDDEVLPTSKGIRVNTEQAPDIIVAMAKTLEITDIEDIIDRLSELVED